MGEVFQRVMAVLHSIHEPKGGAHAACGCPHSVGRDPLAGGSYSSLNPGCQGGYGILPESFIPLCNPWEAGCGGG